MGLTVRDSVGGVQDTTPHCESTGPLLLSEKQSQPVRYTYRVTWNVSISYVPYSDFELKFLPGI